MQLTATKCFSNEAINTVLTLSRYCPSACM